MRFWAFSDNHDTLTGLRLAGIEGEILSFGTEAEKRINTIAENSEIGILLVTAAVYKRHKVLLDRIRLQKQTPLVIEIPDRHNGSSGNDITDYIRDAIGVKI